jgi:beta-glucosidase
MGGGANSITMLRTIVASLSLISLSSSFASASTYPRSNAAQPLYKNPAASIEDRVNDLLPRMTVQEKVAQLFVEFFSHHPMFTVS